MKYARIKVVLFARPLADGSKPVYLRVTYARKSKYFPLNKQCLPEQFDTKAGRFTKRFPNHVRENDLLRTIEQRGGDILFEWQRQNIPFDFAEFEKQMFAGTESKSPVVWLWVFGISEQLEQENRIGYGVAFRSLAAILKQYAPKAQLSDINAAWLQGLDKFMRTKHNYKAGGIGHSLRILRIACNRAVKSGEMPDSWKPFKGFSFAGVRVEAKHRAITLEQMRALKDAPLEGEFERFALDLFLFSFYCWGMNFADIANLQHENIRDFRIEYRRQKTGRLYSINLSPQAARIIDRYKSQDSHLFPIYRDGVHTSEKKKFSRRRDLRHRVNEALRAIVGRVGISPDGFTLYVARHTYATALKRAGFAPTLVQDALGHADLKMTQVYLDRFQDSALDAANEAILGEVG